MAPKKGKAATASKPTAAEEEASERIQNSIRGFLARRRVAAVRAAMIAAITDQQAQQQLQTEAAAKAILEKKRREQNATTVGAAMFLSSAEYAAALKNSNSAVRTQRLIADPQLLETATRDWRRSQIPRDNTNVVRWQPPTAKLPAASQKQTFVADMSQVARVMDKQACARTLHPVPPQRPSTAPAKVRSAGGANARDKLYGQFHTTVEQTWRKQQQKLKRPLTAADKYSRSDKPGAVFVGPAMSPRLPPNTMWVRREQVTKFSPKRAAGAAGAPGAASMSRATPKRVLMRASACPDPRAQKIGTAPNVPVISSTWLGAGHRSKHSEQRGLVTAPGRLRGSRGLSNVSPVMRVRQTMQRAMTMPPEMLASTRLALASTRLVDTKGGSSIAPSTALDTTRSTS